MQMRRVSEALHAAVKHYLSLAFTSDFAATKARTTARWPEKLA